MAKKEETKIVLFKGGLTDYIGELATSMLDNPTWYRINNPCMVQGDAKGMKLIAVQGNDNLFERYVDIRIPEGCILEILTVDPTGELMKAYKKESSREKSAIIQSAGGGLKLV